MYKLDNRFSLNDFSVTIVGCGGTGGFVADGLCRLLPSRARLILVDHDRVEDRNLIRQNFSRGELGQFKSEVLAHRLACRYERPVAYSVLPISMFRIAVSGLVIGCVDNGPARREIAEQVKHSLSPYYGFSSWWIDAGNGEHHGQVIIGNSLGGNFDLTKEKCMALPLPTLQRPELLSQPLVRTPSCAQIGEQGPTINQAMAVVVVEVVRRIIEGTCSWMQLYLDLEAGTLTNVLATPELVQRILGVKGRKYKERR